MLEGILGKLIKIVKTLQQKRGFYVDTGIISKALETIGLAFIPLFFRELNKFMQIVQCATAMSVARAKIN